MRYRTIFLEDAMKWLITYDTGIQEVMEAEDFNDLHGKVDSDDVIAIVRLNSNIVAESYCPFR